MSPGETNVSRRDYVKQGAVQISYCLCDSSQTPASMGSPLSPLLEIRSELSNADNDKKDSSLTIQTLHLFPVSTQSISTTDQSRNVVLQKAQTPVDSLQPILSIQTRQDLAGIQRRR